MTSLLLNISRILSLMLLASFIHAPMAGNAQTKFQGQDLNVSVTGTSSLHDWEMKSNKGRCDAAITITNDVVTISGLTFVMPAESLKSGHSAMDKNTYKAMDTKKHANIMFAISTITSIKTSGLNTYVFKGTGKLTIAGVTKQTDLVTTLKYNPADKSFTCTGTKKFKMSEYGVKPPTVMLGTIKTGDEISINYNIIIKS